MTGWRFAAALVTAQSRGALYVDAASVSESNAPYVRIREADPDDAVPVKSTASRCNSTMRTITATSDGPMNGRSFPRC